MREAIDAHYNDAPLPAHADPLHVGPEPPEPRVDARPKRRFWPRTKKQPTPEEPPTSANTTN
jgi:hypothetical protein